MQSALYIFVSRSRANALRDVIEIRAEKVADIPRPDQTFLATSAIRQPESNGGYTLGRYRRTDSRYPEDRFQTTRLHLRSHSLQELFQRVGRRRLAAFWFAESSTFALEIDRSNRPLDRFRFPCDPSLVQVKHILARQKFLPRILAMLGVIHDRGSDRALDDVLNRRLNKRSAALVTRD